MDADWGSSSDEESAADRKNKEAAKLNETLSLLESFNKVKAAEEAAIEKKYGSMDPVERFRAERSAAAGKAMWAERKERAGKEAAEQQDIDSSMKAYAMVGVVIIIVLAFALVGMYEQFSSVLSGGGGNSTETAAGVKGGRNSGSLKTHMPPVGIIAGAVVVGIAVPSVVLICRNRRVRGPGGIL